MVQLDVNVYAKLYNGQAKLRLIYRALAKIFDIVRPAAATQLKGRISAFGLHRYCPRPLIFFQRDMNMN